MRTIHATVLVLLLVIAGSGLMYAKVTRLGLPLLPGQQEPIWTIEARVAFDGTGSGTVVDLDIPDNVTGYVRLDEYFVSRQYGLNIQKNGRDRRVEWSTRRARGPQRLYYRIELAPEVETLETTTPSEKAPRAPKKPAYEEPLASAVEDVLAEVRNESADIFTFVSRLLRTLNDPSPDGNVQVLRENIERDSAAWVERLIHVLAGARISARMVRGVVLADGVSDHELVPWLEVHNGDYWEGFDPQSGNRGYPEEFVRWSTGSDPVLRVTKGRNPTVSFAISHHVQTLTRVARDRADSSDSLLADLLLFNLPVSTQNVYRVLLMVPIGALIVAFMRTVIGVPTLGTFMPILIAIAFRETQLAWGIVLFTVISLAGLTLRFYLERLQLLLVPRLCAVLVLVVLLMLVISLLSARLGFDRAFSIALFPIVILAMVIEHLSVVWEESGAGAAFREALGSLVVASLGYLVMTNGYLTHLVFLFPEVLLILLAAFILLGRYTGYRAVELLRFRDIVEKPANAARADP